MKNEQSKNEMNTEAELSKKDELSEEEIMSKNKLPEEETTGAVRAAKWSNRKLADDIPEDDMLKELNNLLNEPSQNESSKDELSEE